MVVALAYRVRVEGLTGAERDELDVSLHADLGTRSPLSVAG